jgi:hypothetical protein
LHSFGYKYFEFKGKTCITITWRGKNGLVSIMTFFNQPIAKITLAASDDWCKTEKVLFNANGKLSLYFVDASSMAFDGENYPKSCL